MEKLKQAKDLYKALQKDDKSVFFANEKLTKQVIKKASRSRYEKGKVFLAIYKNLDDVNIQKEEVIIPTHVLFVEKKSDVDRSTLYSFSRPFELLHADIADIRFFAKSAANLLYCLLFVDLFTQKIYIYPMKKRHLLAKKMEIFYQEVIEKRKNSSMRLQTDLEFQQNEIKRLNKKYNEEMFSTKLRGGKAFAAEQKIREFKKLLLKMKTLFKKSSKRLKPNDVIKKVTTNLNKTKTEKYQMEPEEVEKKALSDDNFREKYDFYRLEKVGKHANRLDRYNIKKDINNPKKLRDPLQIGEKVLVLAERLKKEHAPGRLYKATTQNKSYFGKKIFIIKERFKMTSDDWYYWLSEENSDVIGKNRFIRQELYPIDGQWSEYYFPKRKQNRRK